MITMISIYPFIHITKIIQRIRRTNSIPVVSMIYCEHVEVFISAFIPHPLICPFIRQHQYMDQFDPSDILFSLCHTFWIFPWPLSMIFNLDSKLHEIHWSTVKRKTHGRLKTVYITHLFSSIQSLPQRLWPEYTIIVPANLIKAIFSHTITNKTHIVIGFLTISSKPYHTKKTWMP